MEQCNSHRCAQKPHQCKHCGKRSPEPSLENRRRCHFCSKEMARQCLYEHIRYHCQKNPKRIKRTFKTRKCPDCAKRIHEKSFARHVRSHSKKCSRSCSMFKSLDNPSHTMCQEAQRKPSGRGESGSNKEAHDVCREHYRNTTICAAGQI